MTGEGYAASPSSAEAAPASVAARIRRWARYELEADAAAVDAAAGAALHRERDQRRAAVRRTATPSRTSRTPSTST